VRFRFLLRPGWLALTLAVLLFAAACFMILSPWQFRRNAERVTQNAAVSSSQTVAPAPLDQVVRGNGEPAAVEYRPVTMTGHFLPSGEALARLRTVQGEPAYEVLTPFQLARGGVILIDRGYVRPVGDVSIPSFAAPPGGEVTVSARVRQDEPDYRAAFDQDGHRQVYAVNSAIVGQAAGLTIRPGYFELLADSPGVLNPLPLPQLDSGPFFSYALQWIAFGSMAILALIYFTWRELQPGGVLTQERSRERRRSVAEMIAEEEAAERRRDDEDRATDEDATEGRETADQHTG
jgi:cytochrome oxidase assembly protein ShyY1